MLNLMEQDVRAAIRKMWWQRAAWFLGNLAVSLGLAALSLTSSGLASSLLLAGSIVCGMLCIVFGMFLIGFRSEVRAALRDVARFRGDRERFMRLHRQIYKFPGRPQFSGQKSGSKGLVK